jgi:hypothetical protein
MTSTQTRVDKGSWPVSALCTLPSGQFHVGLFQALQPKQGPLVFLSTHNPHGAQAASVVPVWSLSFWVGHPRST